MDIRLETWVAKHNVSNTAKEELEGLVEAIESDAENKGYQDGCDDTRAEYDDND